MATLADYNARITARAELYRADARILREQAEAVSTGLRHELLKLAEAWEDFADSIEGLRSRDD